MQNRYELLKYVHRADEADNISTADLFWRVGKYPYETDLNINAERLTSDFCVKLVHIYFIIEVCLK